MILYHVLLILTSTYPYARSLPRNTESKVKVEVVYRSNGR
jgi:hypothetical protein